MTGGRSVAENGLRISDKELFYSAMMMNLDRLVNVEYSFPADRKKLEAEMEDVKRTLNRKKLLRENSKGEFAMDLALSTCVAYCAQPEKCSVYEAGGVYATVYSAAGSFMVLERVGAGENLAMWFGGEADVNKYLLQRVGGNGGDS
jgi:hypothetical protein